MMERVARQNAGGQFGNQSLGALSNLIGSGGLTPQQAGLAGQLTGGQFQNPLPTAGGAMRKFGVRVQAAACSSSACTGSPSRKRTPSIT